MKYDWLLNTRQKLAGQYGLCEDRQSVQRESDSKKLEVRWPCAPALSR